MSNDAHSQNPMLNNYIIYTDEQMDGFILDGIMHKTIREVIHSRNTSALYDLIIYTDTNDPDVLSDALNTLTTEDLMWFITNRDVIKTMYPATYTNILSNTFCDWKHKLDSPDHTIEGETIKALLGLFDPTAEDYNEVLEAWLSYDTIIELFDYLSEFNPKTVIQSGADRDLFHLLEQILLTKIKLANGDFNKIPCFYTADAQTYLDMLGNYVMPHLGQCDPMIVRAYDAMQQYLVASGNLYEAGIHFRIYFQFANKFHDDDREIFRQICQVISRFPEFVQFTTEYGGLGLFLECCRFDMPDELLLLLAKYQIIPAKINYDSTNYKILAKIFYAATQPEPRPQIYEALHSAGYFKAYQEWFKNSGYEDLLAISSIQWPLVAFFNNDNTPSHNPASQKLINLKDYDSAALLMQFLWVNDLTNTGEIQNSKTDHLLSVLRHAQISCKLSGISVMKAECLEFDKYLLSRQFIQNPQLIRNKLYQLAGLTRAGLMTPEVYKYLEQEVFTAYIHDLKSEKFETAELGQLLTEYQPNYLIWYWEALMKSALKANSAEFIEAVELLKNTYFQQQTQLPPTPNELISTICFHKKYLIKCETETLIGKFCIILKEFYKSDTINHCDILEQLLSSTVHIKKYVVGSYNGVIPTILVYSTKSEFEFQLNETLIAKIHTELEQLASKPLNSDTFGNILTVLSIVLYKHCDMEIGRQTILTFLTDIFIVNETMSLHNLMEINIMDKRITPESCDFMQRVLANSQYLLEINDEHAATLGMSIRPSNKEYQKIQISRRRNWCANRQITCGHIELLSIADPNTNEFLCPITFEPLNKGDWIINLTTCGHKFSTTGIIEWCREKKTCPVCRADLATSKLSGANCEMLELI